MNVLLEADSLINGDRAAAYGSPTEQYEHLADLWGAYLGVNMTALDAVNMMILVKVNRARDGFHRDSYVDTAGYAGVAEKMQNELALKDPIISALVEPRVWDDIAKVPIGVRVVDSQEDVWAYSSALGWGFVQPHSPHITHPTRESSIRWACRPYTEVLA